MITARDVDFHTPDDADHHWAETNMFNFFVPEHGLAGTVYTCVRKGLGVCVSDVILFNRLSRNRWDVLYIDTRAHLPAPERLSDYTLENGLSVRVVQAPWDYRVDYQGGDDCEFQLAVTGLMDPYDIHDHGMAPTARAEAADQIESSSFGAGYSGHFDMTARVVGSLTLYGRAFPVDCVATMDHSWGPRTERGMRAMCWSNGHFGDDYAWHGLWEKRLLVDPADEFRLAHGYILEDGKAYGLKAGSMVATRDKDDIPVALELSLTDLDDRHHSITGRALATHDWVPHPSLHVHLVFQEFEARGRTGHGLLQEALPLELMAGITGRAEVARMWDRTKRAMGPFPPGGDRP